MADTSTPKLSHTSSRIHIRGNQMACGNHHAQQRRVMPSRLTVEFIRQFARAYHVTSILPDDFNGIVLN